MTTNARDEKWSPWFQWAQIPRYPEPVKPNTIVQIKNIDGDTLTDYYEGRDIEWCEVIAYRYKIKEPESEYMKRGKTEAETLALNGWKVGDILEGDEGNGPDRILITAIGEDRLTCKWDYKCTGEYQPESGNTTLSCREWRKVGYRAGLDQSEVTPEEEEAWQAKEREQSKSSGGDNDYWIATVNKPKRLEPYQAECEDLIELFQMTFQEGEAFKALWRKGQLRIGNGKPGDTLLRNSEKAHHYSGRMVAMESE